MLAVTPRADGRAGALQLFDELSYTLFEPSRYRYTSSDVRLFELDETAGLQKVKDLNGNTLTVSAAGITHSSGKGLAFTRDGQGRITRVTGPDGRSLVYDYDGAGDLVSVEDREAKTTTFTYAAQPHLLERIQDALGRTPIRNEYYANGRLKSHTGASTARCEYTHELGTRQEIVKDRNDQVRVLEYDERGNVVKETQPDGKVVKRTFDARNNRTSETEPDDPSATPTPATTGYSYDASDNLLTATDANGHTTAYSYDARRQVVATTDARGKTSTSLYDAKGNLTQTTDVAGHVTVYTYDARGNVLTQTVTVGGAQQVTRYEYDVFGNLAKETDALGHATAYTHDANGNRLTQTRTRTTPAGVETLTRFRDNVGAIIGAADAYLAGSDPDGMQEAAVRGGLLGSVTGGLFLVRFLQPVLLVAGNALATVGVADALEQDNYELAGFRSTLFCLVLWRSSGASSWPTRRRGVWGTRPPDSTSRKSQSNSSGVTGRSLEAGALRRKSTSPGLVLVRAEGLS